MTVDNAIDYDLWVRYREECTELGVEPSVNDFYIWLEEEGYVEEDE